MPTVRSKLKDALDEALKEANDCLLRFPQEHTALKYVNGIRKLQQVCEERKRY